MRTSAATDDNRSDVGSDISCGSKADLELDLFGSQYRRTEGYASCLNCRGPTDHTPAGVLQTRISRTPVCWT